jgi:hypothetical protein
VQIFLRAIIALLGKDPGATSPVAYNNVMLRMLPTAFRKTAMAVQRAADLFFSAAAINDR